LLYYFQQQDRVRQRQQQHHQQQLAQLQRPAPDFAPLKIIYKLIYLL
jgi:hypothetical protein